MITGVFQKAVAANLKTHQEDDVSTELRIRSSDGIFSGSASFTFEVKNGLEEDQAGTVSYVLTTEKGEKVT